jgi:epoxyqueuosine reductase
MGCVETGQSANEAEMKKRSAAGSRREFLKQAGRLGALMCLASTRLFPLRKANLAMVPETAPACRSRSVSIRRLPELQEWLARLDREGRLSADPTWRKYIGSFRYTAPATLANARSLVIMAVPLKVARIAFHLGGEKRDVLIPCGYVDDGHSLDDLQDMLYREGIVAAGHRLERARLPLKQLAVRSGLAAYGRNNITYIDGFGSFHQLLAFYTDQALEDHWGKLQMYRLCKGCRICRDACPTGAIRSSDFVIDPARCITLFNEYPDPLPAWIPAAAHNALVGCLHCQLTCPGNEELVGQTWDLGDVSEAETTALLGGDPDAKTRQALLEKLRRIDGGDNLPYIARNLRLVLDAPRGPKAT